MLSFSQVEAHCIPLTLTLSHFDTHRRALKAIEGKMKLLRAQPEFLQSIPIAQDQRTESPLACVQLLTDLALKNGLFNAVTMIKMERGIEIVRDDELPSVLLLRRSVFTLTYLPYCEPYYPYDGSVVHQEVEECVVIDVARAFTVCAYTRPFIPHLAMDSKDAL